MSESSSRCPNTNELKQLLLGLASVPDTDLWAQHLESCEICVAALRTLQADVSGDTLLNALHRAPEVAASLSSETEIPALIDRVKDLGRRARGVEDTVAAGPGDVLNSDDGHDYLQFLDPPQASGELGRLGTYRILRVLGTGGMGIVFEAEDSQLLRRVALKVMRPLMSAGPLARERFLREARLAAAIDEEHIVTIFQVGEEHGVSYLAMQLLRGETLQQRLDRKGRLPPAELLRIGREIAEGLSAAHARGLLHRDIKPANVFLATAGSAGSSAKSLPADDGSAVAAPKVKLLDFGLARAIEDGMHLTRTSAIAGTPAYMSPEQALGQPVDPRCDLFSLGCVLYQVGTGRLPFHGSNPTSILLAITQQAPPPPRTLNAELPESVERLILRLLNKDPAQRYQSAVDVIAAIRAIEEPSDGAARLQSSHVAGQIIPLEPTPQRQTCAIAPLPAARRRPGWTVVAGLTACLLVATALYVQFAPDRPDRVPDVAPGAAQTEMAGVRAGEEGTTSDQSGTAAAVNPRAEQMTNAATSPAENNAVVVTTRPDNGFDIQAHGYTAVVSAKGSIDQLTVSGIDAMRGTELGRMQTEGTVSVQQDGTKLTFVNGEDYREELEFGPEGLTARITLSENASRRHAVDGKWYFVWYANHFTPDAQYVHSREPAREFVLPTTSRLNCDQFAVTLSNGSQVDVTVSGDMSFPSDPGAFGYDWIPRYTWARGYMKPNQVYTYNYRVIPAPRPMSVFAMPPLVLESNVKERYVALDQPLTLTTRVRPEDGRKLLGRLQDTVVHWTVTDMLGAPVFEATGKLEDSRYFGSGDAAPRDSGAATGDRIVADLVATLTPPTGRLGWFRVQVTLEDTAGNAIPNRVVTDYAVIRSGILPELPAAPVDLPNGLNPDYSAWLGLQLDRVSAAEALPAMSESARRTGLRYFHQINVPPGVTSSQAFAEHVREVVSRYKDHCQAWEIINEPQLTLPPAEKYVEYLQAAHAVIRELDPDALVVGPASLGLDLGFIDRVYQLGGGAYIDVVTVHPYSAHWRGWVEQNMELEHRNLRELLKRHGAAATPLWFTESGFENSFLSTDIAEVQARFVVQEFLLAASWGMPTSQVSYFFLKDHGYSTNYLVRADNSLSPAAVAFRNYSQQTHGLRFERMLELGKNRMGMLFRGSDRQVAALFSYDQPAVATLMTDQEQVKLFDFFGNQTTLNSNNGLFEVSLSGYPVYLELGPDAEVSGVPLDWGPNLANGGSALSSSGQSTAAQVVDGVCAGNGINAAVPGWVSDQGNELPQWVEVKLPKPTEVRRFVMYTNSSFCGIAGPRDFDVQVHGSDGWKTVHEERGNVDQWVFEYPLDAVTTDRVRILVRAVNNGGLRDDPRPYAELVARVAEIELYGR